MTFGILTALSFFAIPVTLPRAIMVIAFSAISGFSAVCLFAILLSRGIRGRWRKSWAVAAAVVVAMEAMLVGGLNTYADSEATSATALLQDSYAEVAAAISLGDAIQQGRAPSDVTFATVQARAFAVYLRLSVLDVPGQLADYTSSLKAWAKDVVTASIKAQTGSPWQGVPDTPAPFQVNMTAGQANAAFATTLRQIATLIEFGDHAVAARDPGAMRFVGARLNGQAYWLEGIYTSADPNVVAAQLHFIEPVNAPTSGGVAEADTGMRLVAAVSVQLSLFPRHWGPWRSPRRVPTCQRDICISRVRRPLSGLWRSATNYSVACAATGGKFNGACINDSSNQQWVGATQGILPMINASGAQPIGGPGASVGKPDAQLPPALAAFYAQCQAKGGVYGGIMSGRERLPTTEGGWTCQAHGCWDYLTYSGTPYRGGQPGCPELGLVPKPFGPVGGIVQQVAGLIKRLIPFPPTWDGTYNLQPSSVACTGSSSSPYYQTIRRTLNQAMPSSTLVVRGNNVVGPPSPVPIDSTGRAVWSYPIGTIGTLKATYSFTRDAAGVAHVAGDLRISAASSGGSSTAQVDCSAPFIGTQG